MKRFYLFCAACVAFTTMAFNTQAQNTYYVKSTALGTNDGSSWANAFNDLQRALEAATSGDQIWVAEGIYKPSKDLSGNASPANNRTKTFLLKNGVKLYGGFAGNEVDLASRDAIHHITILHGDIDNNDGNDTFANNAGNAYHVVTVNNLTATTLLDGFTIKAGNANLADHYNGVSWGHKYGAGVIANQTGSYFTINNCNFMFNYAMSGGGGVYLANGTSTLTNDVFYYNYTHDYGGGLHLNYNVSNTIIVNCLFVQNNSSYEAGGLYNWGTSTQVVNCTFYGNNADATGGGLYNREYNSTIANTIFWGNTSNGSIDIGKENSTPTVTYSTTESAYAGTGNWYSNPVFDNPSDPDGPDNLWRTHDDGLMLHGYSYSINSGSNALVPAGITTDILGDGRFQGNVNIGAYETIKPSVIRYVNASAAGSNDGTSWANAYTDLQSALDHVLAGDQIYVAKGTYKPSRNFDGSTYDPRAYTFTLKNFVKIYGGFAGTESSYTERNITANPTILSGDFFDDDIYQNKTNNALHVVSGKDITTNAAFDGFIIEGGYADITEEYLGVTWGHHLGGGMILANCSGLTINNCIFKNNYGGFGGGALLLYHSSPDLINTIFTGNRCGNNYGGAVYAQGGSSNFSNSVFADNYSGYRGGAIFLLSSSTSVVNSTFVNNTAVYEGGALYLEGGSANIKNSTLWNNRGKDNTTLGGSNITVSYSTVEGGFAGTNVISDDPQFVNYADPDGLDDTWLTADDGLLFLSTSPAANSGSNVAIPAGINKDIMGNNRVINGTVAMGAYEAERLGATVTIQMSSADFTYDGTAKTATATTSPEGLPIVIHYKRGSEFIEAPVDAGTYQVVAVINDLTYSGSAVVDLVIHKAQAQIIVTNTNQTFTGDALVPTVQTVPNDLPYYVYFEKDEDYFDYAVDAGTYTMYVGIDNYNYEGEVVETFTVNKAPLPITFSNLTQTYDGAVKTVTATSCDECNPEDIVVVYKQNGNTVEPIAAGSYTVEASIDYENHAGNATATLTILKASQALSFEPLNPKTYGDEGFTLHGSSSAGLPVAFTSEHPDVATIDGDLLTIVGAGTTIITMSQSGTENFNAATLTQVLVVNKKSQSLTFTTITDQVIGNSPISLSGTSTSGLLVSFTSSDPSVIAISGSTASIVGTGTVIITATQSGDKNFTAANAVSQTITVAKKEQSITFAALPEKIFGEAPFMLNAVTTSGLAITYTSSNESVATIEGNMVTLHGGGEVTITATQSGNNIFSAATPVTQTLSVKLVTGLEDASNTLVKIYPNPVTDYILVESKSVTNAYRLIDAYGKEIVSSTFAGSDDAFKIDVMHLPTGIYYLSVNQGKKTITTRLVKK